MSQHISDLTGNQLCFSLGLNELLTALALIGRQNF
uniref:Uncharacterized protein n=1 Tax=Anguilla anguilla TaxID=7936 RepID=A0A0E9TFD3_ANGAN